MTRALAIAASALALASCTKENVRGRASFWLSDCDGCDGATSEQVAGPAVISTEASRLGAEGVCVLMQSTRVSGVTVVLELDAAPGQTPVAVYSEWSHGQRTFDGVAAGGKVVLDGANRTRGRFALRFVDKGPDGVRGTSDDLVRVVADGQFYLATQIAPTSEPAARLDPGGDDEIDLELENWGDLVPSGDGTDGTDKTASAGENGGCGGDTGSSGGDGVDLSGGCGGDTGGGSSADTSGCDGGGSDSGCGGDTGGADLSGCGDAAGGCAGDLSRGAKKHASRARGAARFGPVFALAFAQALGRKRRRAARD